MQVIKISLQPSKKHGNGRWHLYLNQVKFPEEFIPLQDMTHFVSIPANTFAGNHKHIRQEVLLGLHPELMLIWQDKAGNKHREDMNPDGELFLFFIPSSIPHVVVNKSQTSSAILYEWTDSESLEKENIDLI